jgi:flagellar biosynthetic protein FlhB
MAESLNDKQFEATPHRRQKAREQGQVARSQDLSSAALLLGSLLVLRFLGPDAVNFLLALMRRYWAEAAPTTVDVGTATATWIELTSGLAVHLLPILVAFLLLALASHWGQFGLLWLPEKLAPDLERIDPIGGFQRIFSLQNLVRLGFSLGKVTVVAVMAIGLFSSLVPALLATSGMEVPQLTEFLASSALDTATKLAGALLVLALADFFYQRWKFERELRMSQQELRDEFRELQGDPEIIRQRKAVQRQLAMSRLKTIVPSSEAVITNPTELAIAIRYDIDTMVAPVVVAKGAGLLAQRIRRLALESGVPIVERKELAQALYRHVEVGQPIPSEQYAAVAEVLRYVYQLKGKTISAEQAARVAVAGASSPSR